MGNAPDAHEHEPYQRALAAIYEVVQALLTLQTLATLDGNLRSLVVESITALLDDLTREPHTPQPLRYRQVLAARLAIPSAAAYRRLDEAMRQVADASRSLTTAKIDTLATETRSDLDHAIRSARNAFSQLAKSEGPVDPALLDAITKMKAAIQHYAQNFANLSHQRTSVDRDSTSFVVAPEDSPPYERDTVEPDTVERDTVHRFSRQHAGKDQPSLEGRGEGFLER